MRGVVESAILAPSGHNTQPWLFRVTGGTLELRADRTRALPVVDPLDRALTLSCGAALAFVRVAVRQAGHLPHVARLPDPDDPDLLARVRPGPTRAPSPDDEALFAAIPNRHTNRRPFEDRAPPRDVLEALRETVRAEGAWLRVVSGDEEKEAVAELVAEGDRAQASDPAFRRELAAWIHPNRSGSRDGIPGTAFGLSDLVSIPFPWILRTFDWGGGQAARDRQLATGSPVLLVLGTEEETAEAWLRAGEALGMMLLRATDEGLSASFLNQPIEVPELRPRLAERLGLEGFPQLLLRMGYGSPVPATPRRGVEEVWLA